MLTTIFSEIQALIAYENDSNYNVLKCWLALNRFSKCHQLEFPEMPTIILVRNASTSISSAMRAMIAFRYAGNYIPK